LKAVSRLRKYFIVGLVIVTPLGVTLFILSWAFQWVDRILGRPLAAAVGIDLPGVGVVLLALLILLVGWAVHNALGRRIVLIGNAALARFPLTRRIYSAGSQIVQATLGSDGRIFLRAVLVPYPREGSWAVGFVTREPTPVFSDALGQPCLTVFLPTSFSVPPSGPVLLFPEKAVVALDASVESALKFVISAGAVLPSDVSATQGLDLEKLLGKKPR
jgi:uncharacterized membrane protein